MSFLQLSLAPWVAMGMLLLGAVILITEQRFFKWVKEHWLFRRRLSHRLSTFLILLGLALMAVILLDPRQGETKIKGKIRKDRTIILVDTSTSMLAEDVRPNRLERAVLVGKHFIRKAAGHEIAIIVFADITKKLVPFTTDIDLLDARMDSIKQLKNMNAGSAIGLAIEEAVQHFDPQDDSVKGNLLVITDGEDNADSATFKVPEGISVAFVGIGTTEGGSIPMKDNMGMFYGLKRSQGQTVISKLNQDFFNSALKSVPHAKYFHVQSFDLPTLEILDFFEQRKSQEAEGDNIIRPVALEAWLYPAALALLLGYFLRFLRPLVSILLVLHMANSAQAQEKEVELPAEVVQRIEQLKKGTLDREERINLADQLVQHKMHDMAQALYEENLTSEDIENKPESYFNWATSELETGKFETALQKYEELEREAKKSSNESMLKNIKDNIKRVMVPPPEKKQDKKNQQDNQDQQEQNKQDQNEGGESKDQQGSSQSQNQQKKTESSESSDNKKNPFDMKKDEADSGEDKRDEKDGNDKDKKEASRPQEMQQDGQEKQKIKVSPLLEQLKQDDRKLQLKLLDTSTQKRTDRKNKDW